jgi:hypothetical protein
MTVTPSKTSIPKPASLAGTVFLSQENKTPFVTSIELRVTNSFKLIGKGKTNSEGQFKISNIQPGGYELWVLITTTPAMISGCSDVLVPDSTWKMGIKFGEGKALTMENASLSKAILLSNNLPSSNLKATGFYAVLPGFAIASGIVNQKDVILLCR